MARHRRNPKSRSLETYTILEQAHGSFEGIAEIRAWRPAIAELLARSLSQKQKNKLFGVTKIGRSGRLYGKERYYLNGKSVAA